MGGAVGKRARHPRAARSALALFVAAALVVISGTVPATAVGTGQVVLVSHTPVGPATTPSGGSVGPILSADGAFVTFMSNSANLVAGQTDTNNDFDIFLFERATGMVTLVSHTPASTTTTADAISTSVDVSADGAFVLFRSSATNLVAGQIDTVGDDVFLFERATATVTLVSHTPASATTTANNVSSARRISSDGAFVVFASGATDLVAGQIDTNGAGDGDLFLYERASGAVTLMSHTPASATTTANGNSAGSPILSISADGAFVAFVSSATNLVAGQSDTNGGVDVFLFHRATAAVTLVSRTSAGATIAGNAPSSSASSSADGAFIAFHSSATNLVAGQTDTNIAGDVFLLHRATGAVILVSHTPASATTTADASSSLPAISADGAFVAFSSSATNLVAAQNDSNGSTDYFLFERAGGAVRVVSHTPAGATTTANAGSFGASISADGGFVAFSSPATNLVAGQSDVNGLADVFVFHRVTGALTLVSHTPASGATAANGSSPASSISADGTFVAFSSGATNLVAGQSDANGAGDVFLFRQPIAAPPPADFDGDGDTDRSVFRNGAWYAEGQVTAFLGLGGDIPVPADYDGDGDSDRAVYRDGAWYVEGQATVFFGVSTDIPVPGDYDGDGDVDRAVFRPSVGGWYVEGQATVFLGLSTHIPVPGDYDGNGIIDRAVWNPSVGAWHVQGQATSYLGLNGFIPVPGDYDGDGDANRAVWSPSAGGWYEEGAAPVFLGLNGNVPVPGDYNDDGSTDRAVWTPSVGGWYVQSQPTVFLGLTGDIPLPLSQAVYRKFF